MSPWTEGRLSAAKHSELHWLRAPTAFRLNRCPTWSDADIAGRAATWRQLAREAPTAILAEVLSASPSTAMRHAEPLRVIPEGAGPVKNCSRPIFVPLRRVLGTPMRSATRKWLLQVVPIANWATVTGHVQDQRGLVVAEPPATRCTCRGPAGACSPRCRTRSVVDRIAITASLRGRIGSGPGRPRRYP